MTNERELDIMEVEAEMVVMEDWLKFEREYLGSRANVARREMGQAQNTNGNNAAGAEGSANSVPVVRP